MAGLFTKKKKDDGSNNSAAKQQQQQQQQQQQPPQQRPAPPPNGLGLNNGMGYNNDNGQFNNSSQGYQQPPPAPPLAGGGPMSPMSPTFAQQQQQPQSFAMNGPSQAQQPQQIPTSGPIAPPGAAVAPPPPQLFWTQRRIMGSNPFPRNQHTTSITSTGTDIFLYGGTQRGTPKGDLFVIDSVNLQCQPVAPGGADPPMPKSGHTAVNIGQYIIYFGGWDPTTGQCDDSLHVLHTARKEWNRPPIQGQLPTPRHSHSGCSVGTTMYVFGGQVDNYYLGDIAAFDMKTITQNPRWEIIEPQTESPPARSGHCAAVYDGKIYIFGGADADYFYNDIWCFDTRALTWTPIPASGYLPTGRHGHSCTLVDGVLYIFGGNSPDGSELNDAYAFRIHERRWYLFQNVGPAPSPRSGHTMCTVKDKIFILGGESEQNRMEDSAQIYFVEIPKIRFPDSAPQPGPRQVSSAKLVPNRPGAGSPQPYQQSLTDAGQSDYESDRNSNQPMAPGRPDRPERPARPDRPITQRPASPGTFAAPERLSSSANMTQQMGQQANIQPAQRPLTTMGAPPPRGASSGFQAGGGNASQDSQGDGVSMAARRQTFKDDMNGGYGGAVVGTANNIAMNANRRTMNHIPNGQAAPAAGANPSPLRVINVSSDSPPVSNRSLPGTGVEAGPPTTRSDRRMMSPAAPLSNSKDEEINPYAMEVIAPGAAGKQNQQAGPSGPYIPPPPLAAAAPASNSISVNGTPLPPNMRPPPSTTASPPVSGQIILPPGADKRPVAASIAHQQTAARSPSPASGRGYNRATPTPPPAAGHTEFSSADLAKFKQLESQAEAVREANERLHQQLKDREEDLDRMRRRENWLVTEVMLARGGGVDQQAAHLNDKRLSMADLEKELENQQLEGRQLMITKALVKVKEELRSAKMSIATQAQAASFKIKEAERVRTGALQEAAYLKAKLSSMSNAQQDPGALARVEMDRAADLEKRLRLALGELEQIENRYGKAQEGLQQERMARLAAEERSTGSSVLAEQAQAAHTRALAELASLHSRAAKAEAESREYATQLAESQAGFSGHQSQSSGLLQKVKDLKQQVEEHQTALERTQMAYSAANERAIRAETLSDESSDKLERSESLRSELSSELMRSKGETERLQSKVEELEGRWQISKDEVTTLRKLVEDGLGAFNPRGKSQQSAERKHDSIAILSTVSKVSELEHELSSLKTLHKNSQASASKSAAELAEAMIELSRLEQSSMKARAETISLQRQLAEERDGSAELRSELSKTEQELESKINELENNEVQLGLLKDVMREKGIIAEDVMLQAVVRGSGDYAASMEVKLREAEGKAKSLEQELEETREHFTQQLDAFEAQRQATVQHSEKTSLLLRKLKNDLAATMKDKETAVAELRQVQDEHSRCNTLSSSRDAQSQQQDNERVEMLQMHFDEERRDLTSQVTDLQNRLVDAEMHAAELSQKVISLTERVEEVETLNEAISEQLENMQDQADEFKSKALNQEMQLKSDVERLVDEVHQAQERAQAKQLELQNAFALNEQLESQLEDALQAQAAAVTSAASGSSSAAHAEALSRLDKQRQDLEQRLKKAQDTIQILEGDNSVLEARLQDSEKKVTLLLEDMQNSFTDHSNPHSPLNSANLSGVHQQLNHQLASRSLQAGQSSGAALNSALSMSSPSHSQKPNSAGRAGAASASPSGLQINKKNAARGNMSTSPNHHMNDEDHYLHGTQQNGQQHQQQYLPGHADDDEDMDSGTYRDSVDSITRELEMLKVPWNKGAAVNNTQSTESGRKSSSPMQHYQQQAPAQRQQQQQQYHGNSYGSGAATGNRYLYADDDEDDDDEEPESYLAHLQQRPPQQQQGQMSSNTMDTHSFNDRSPSRLKEYEQMIDEIENARKQH
ncbi:Negative regulator of mitotic exit [Mortierella alpina]|nr:Negative regulator of mitotic exit [Mortierella alpina]